METDLRVSLRRCVAYERAGIVRAVDGILHSLGRAKSYHGQLILLKPNLISVRGPAVACTDAEFIAAVASWFIDHGAKVIVGDSPAFGSVKKVCQKTGVSHALAAMDVQIVEFVTPFKKELPGGVMVKLSREVFECDLYVGLPKIKAHNQMYMTMAMKNNFGVVKGVNKALLHMTHGVSHDYFANIIIDILDQLPAQLHLADGIEVMHQSGPLDGMPLKLGCIGGAVSSLALDSALLNLLELDSCLCPLWCTAKARGLVGWNVADILFTDLCPADFYGSTFIPPSTLNNIRFNPVRFLFGMIKRVMEVAGG